MESWIKNRFTPDILSETAARYGMEPHALKALDGFESFIFQYETDGESRILRVGHAIRRSERLVLGEIDWIQFLTDGGAGVVRLVPSVQGRPLERIPDSQGGYFLATAFRRARGCHAWEVGWSDGLYRNYGRLMGTLHRLTKLYVPRDPEGGRLHWDSPEMLEVETFLPKKETRIREQYRRLMDRIHDLPQTPDSYGLIHQDAHAGNFFVDDGGNITLFDFDDCVYSWFINDLAIVIFYMIVNTDQPGDLLDRFLPPFIKGYQEENVFDPRWPDAIPLFLKLREIDLYAMIHRSFDVENLVDPWCRRFMTGRRERLETDALFAPYDFKRIQEWLL